MPTPSHSRILNLALSLALSGVLGVALPAGEADAQAPRIDWQVSARAASRGSARVIVRLVEEEAPPQRRWQRAREGRAERWARAEDGLMQELRGSGHGRVRRLARHGAIALDATPRTLARLERSGRVLSIHADRLHAPALAQTVPIVGATSSMAAGYDGSGHVIAILDTGIDAGHPFLSGRVVDEACFSGGANCAGGMMSATGPGTGSYCTWSTGCFHGTHVAGVAVGASGSMQGVAPGAGIISIRVFSSFTGTDCGASSSPCALAYTSDIAAGLAHVDTLRASHDIAAVNVSIGGGYWPSQAACDASHPTVKAAMDTLRSAGIPTIVSAGNDGYTSALGSPACISSAVSVGATDNADAVASFSNSAPFLSLMAPGVDVTSSVPEGLLGFSYGYTSGTSMAAPHVAGAWAALAQADPGASVDVQLARLQSTGVPIVDVNQVTTIRIDVWNALQTLPCVGGPDSDGDGVPDDCDNCLLVSNADQRDTNADGFGNLCDADYDDDGMVGGADFGAIGSRWAATCSDPEYDPDIDANGDCIIGSTDFAVLASQFGGAPGPSAAAP